MIKDLTGLINATSNLEINQYTIILALIIVVALLIIKIFDNIKFNSYYKSMLNEKIKK